MYKLLIEWLRVKLNLPDDSIKCESCYSLRLENSRLENQNLFLLEKLISPSRIEEVKTATEFKPIQTGTPNWHTTKTRLEREDRLKEDNRLKDKALKAAGQKDAPQENPKREEATNIAAPSNVIRTIKSIEELEKDFTVDLPTLVNDDQKVIGEK